MKNDANIRNFIEYLGNLHGKSWKICGKSFHFLPFHSTTSFGCPVFRGRFRSFFRSFLEKIGEYRRKMENIVEIFPFSFHFITLSFLNP